MLSDSGSAPKLEYPRGVDADPNDFTDLDSENLGLDIHIRPIIFLKNIKI